MQSKISLHSPFKPAYTVYITLVCFSFKIVFFFVDIGFWENKIYIIIYAVELSNWIRVVQLYCIVHTYIWCLCNFQKFELPRRKIVFFICFKLRYKNRINSKWQLFCFFRWINSNVNCTRTMTRLILIGIYLIYIWYIFDN